MNRRAALLAIGILIGVVIGFGLIAIAIVGHKTSPTKPPDGPFKSVSAAWGSACGVRSDDTVQCWGELDGFKGMWGQIPNGRFKSVETGDHRTCGIRQDGSISCWWHKGYDYASDGFSPPPGSFKQVVVGDNPGVPLGCALKFDGTVICWRDGLHWLEGVAPQAISGAGAFKSLSDYEGTMCGIRADDTVDCWSHNDYGEDSPQATLWLHRSHRWGGNRSGNNDYGQSSPPDGKFISVSMGKRHACGIRVDSTVACWGYSEDGQTASPNGRFIAITAGVRHNCGIRTDESIECWGDNEDGKLAAPSGSFTAISAGPFYTCAIRTDDAVAWWGGRR